MHSPARSPWRSPTSVSNTKARKHCFYPMTWSCAARRSAETQSVSRPRTRHCTVFVLHHNSSSHTDTACTHHCSLHPHSHAHCLPFHPYHCFASIANQRRGKPRCRILGRILARARDLQLNTFEPRSSPVSVSFRIILVSYGLVHSPNHAPSPPPRGRAAAAGGLEACAALGKRDR